MASGAAEPTAKRQKVDEAEEEEDPLVRRREELALGFANARAEGMRLYERLVQEAKEEGERLKREAEAEAKRMEREASKRAMLDLDRTLSEAEQSFRPKLRSVCADLEAKNDKLLRRLPPELWQKIIDENVQQNDMVALALTCKFFREKQKDLGKKVETNLSFDRLLDLRKSGKVVSHTFGWFRWVCETFKIWPGFQTSCSMNWVDGAVHQVGGNLVNYAALQGSVEILRWLMEEKWYEVNEYTGLLVGIGGSIEVLEYLRGMDGYEFGERACEEAARRGHLEALKFLRGLDSPCPWNVGTCAEAARGGHLEVLKWVRAQEPPCPWSRHECREIATSIFDLQRQHQHVVDWIDERMRAIEDESDGEPYWE